MQQQRVLDYKKIGFVLAGVLVVVVLFFSFGSDSSDSPTIKMVSGTEYISGEYGQAIIRISDEKGNGITGGSCVVTILYPDKSVFLLDAQMVPSSEEGNYYRSFITPNVTGIYEEVMDCTGVHEGRSYELSISSSFHVSIALNYVLELVEAQEERYNNLIAQINQSENRIMDQVRVDIDENQQEIELLLNETAKQIEEQQNAQLHEVAGNLTNRLEDVEGKFANLGSAMANIFNGS